MDSAIFDRICAIIQKSSRVNNEDGRLGLLGEVYGTAPIPLVLEDCCEKRRDEFASCITRQAKDFTLSDGQNVLVRLLGILRRDFGTQDQAEVDALVRELSVGVQPAGVALSDQRISEIPDVSSQSLSPATGLSGSDSTSVLSTLSDNEEAPSAADGWLERVNRLLRQPIIYVVLVPLAIAVVAVLLNKAWAPSPKSTLDVPTPSNQNTWFHAEVFRVAVTEGAECSSELNEGGIRFITNAQSNEWELCHYLIRPNRFINPSVENQSPLGVLSAKMLSAEPFFFDSVTTTRSSAYLEMVTFDEGIGLQIHCGLVDDRNGLQAFYSVSTAGPPETLKCSDTIEDKDPSDGRCDIKRKVFGELLERDIDYEVRLEAMQESPGDFLCTVNDVTYGPDFIRMVDTNFNRESLADLQFQRWMEVNMEGPRESVFVVSDIKESR